MSSCWTRTHVSFSTTRHFSCWTRKTRLRVEQEDMSSRWTRRLSSCSTSGPVFLLNRKTRRPVFLLNTKTCLAVEQEDMSSRWTRRHVFFLDKKTCLLLEQEDTSSWPYGHRMGSSKINCLGLTLGSYFIRCISDGPGFVSVMELLWPLSSAHLHSTLHLDAILAIIMLLYGTTLPSVSGLEVCSSMQLAVCHLAWLCLLCVWNGASILDEFVWG